MLDKIDRKLLALLQEDCTLSLQALADAANRLSEGEVLQMNNAHNPDTDEAQYFAVIERKTACLFEAAAHMAAAIAEATPEMEDACTRYCLHLGNAFQIADDILDYAGEAAAIGKNLGADLREGKVTLPLLYAMQLASAEDRECIREAVRKGEGDFEHISRIVIASGALEKCRERALKEAADGEKAILLQARSLFYCPFSGLDAPGSPAHREAVSIKRRPWRQSSSRPCPW